MGVNYLYGAGTYGRPYLASGEYVSLGGSATTTLLDTSVLHPNTGGYVDHLWIGNNDSNTHDALEAAVLKVYVDGNATPDISVDLGGIFMTPWSSTLVYDGGPISFKWGTGGGVFGGSGHLKIKMPFTSSIKLTLTNGNSATTTLFYNLSYKLTPSFSINWGLAKRLKMAQLFGTSVVKYTNQVIASDSGAGLIYGWTVVFKGGDSNLFYLEGDPYVKIDGEGSASMVWSGTEDFFLNGGFFANGTLVTGDHGCVVVTAGSGLVGAYRFFLDDPIPFTTGFEFGWPNGNASQNTVVANTLLYSTLYYYLST